MDLQKLSDPFPHSAIHWRVQGKAFERAGKHSAMALAYIDARDVMDRLDEVCGPGGWQSEFTETARGRVICRLGINIEGGWVWKSDGAGDTDVEGEKGGISDALKRAAVSWGVGRYLYRLDSPWVPCEVSEKGAWKKWIGDPWACIKKAAPAHKPEAAPPFNARAATDRVIAKLKGSRDMADLADRWKSEAATIADVKEASAPMFAEINAAKDGCKTELQPNQEKAA